MKPSFQEWNVVVAGTALVAATYGLVRYSYGLVLPAVQADLGVTDATAGVISGMTSASYCVAAALALITCTRWPRQVVLAAGVVGAAGAAGVAIAGGVGTFAISVVIAAAGAGGASPALVVLLRQEVPKGRDALSQSVVNSGAGPGLVVASLLALAFAQQRRVAWVIASAATGAATVWVLVAGRRSQTGASEAAARAVDASAAWVAPAVGALLFGIGSAAVWTFGRTVLEQGGLSPATSSAAWLFLGAGAVLSAPLTPVLLRLGTSPAWVVTLLITAGATAVFTTASLWWTAWVAALVFSLGWTAATTVLIAWASDVSTTPGAATSSFFIAGTSGQIIGAPLVGQLMSSAGSTIAFVVAAALIASGAVIVPHRPTAVARRETAPISVAG